MAGKYGIQIGSFIVENVSVPPEVEQAIDKKSSMAAVGNLNDFVKYQMAKGMEAPGGGGPAGMASELAVGFAIAQQIMQQQGDHRVRPVRQVRLVRRVRRLRWVRRVRPVRSICCRRPMSPRSSACPRPT